MKKVFLAMTLFCYACIVFASVSIQIEPSSVGLGESFNLNLIQRDTRSSQPPDLTPLKTDFTIQATEHRISTQIINGSFSNIDQWVITLLPKKVGTCIIPSIQMGQEQSPPSQIQVTSLTTQPPSTMRRTQHRASTQLSTHVSEKSPYIHQQVLYTVLLYHKNQLINTNYQPPNLHNALVVPLGEATQRQDAINGELFTVEELRYALFPQQSGQQTLESPTLHAMHVIRGMPERINITSDPINLDVQSIPAPYHPEDWLPAKAVSITEQYDDEKSLSLPEGGTLMRTITLKAQGLPAELLPTLHHFAPDEISVYPEKPELTNTSNLDNVIGEETIQISYLLKKSGDIDLPAYQIKWFNTVTKQEEIATLPKRTLHVTPVLSAQTQPFVEETKPELSHAFPETPIIQTSWANYLAWGVAAFFAFAWIVTVAYLYWRRNPSQAVEKSKPVTKSSGFSWNNLRHVLLSNDSEKAQAAILSWARVHWPNIPINHLEAIIQLIDDEVLEYHLNELLQARYGKASSNLWNGETLWKAIRAYRPKKPTTKKQKSQLPPINP